MHAPHRAAGPLTLHAPLPPGLGDRVELRVNGQSEKVVAVQLMQQIQHFRRTVVTVAAHQNAHLRPAASDAVDHVPKHARDLRAGRPLAGAQQRQERLARVALKNVDRLEAVAARVRVEQRELLPTVDQIIRVVDIEHDRMRRSRIAVQEEIDEADADAIERSGVGGILEPRDRRLARKIDAALGCAIAGNQKRGIAAQRVDVVGILVAGRDRHHPGGDHVRIGVRDEQRITRIGHIGRDHGGDAKPRGALAQEHEASIRGEVACVARSCEWLASDG